MHILYDWLSCISYKKDELKRLAAAGAVVMPCYKRLPQINYRNHMKMVIIDGIEQVPAQFELRRDQRRRQMATDPPGQPGHGDQGKSDEGQPRRQQSRRLPGKNGGEQQQAEPGSDAGQQQALIEVVERVDVARQPAEQVGPVQAPGLRRITSYNVCYTKLLRAA